MKPIQRNMDAFVHAFAQNLERFAIAWVELYTFDMDEAASELIDKYVDMFWKWTWSVDHTAQYPEDSDMFWSLDPVQYSEDYDAEDVQRVKDLLRGFFTQLAQNWMVCLAEEDEDFFRNWATSFYWLLKTI